MRTLYIILLLFLYPFFIAAQAQPKHSFFFNSGYTYNTPIELNEQVVENSQGFLFTIGGVKRLLSFRKNSFESGFGLKTVFVSGEIGGDKFTASTLRILIPARFVFPIADKWEMATGINIQNNVDFNTVDYRLRNKYDWRYNVFGELKYFFKEDWFLTTSASFNLREVPDPFFINDPKVAFLVGVGKRVLIVNKRKIARKAKRQQKRKEKNK